MTPAALPLDEQNFGAREMKGGDVHSFPLAMQAGEYCEISVEQNGIDVVIELIEPGGKRRGSIDGFTGARGAETTFVTANEAGEYRLEIKALNADSPVGAYTVTTGRRRATAEDRASDLALRIARASSETEVDALLSENHGLINYTLAAQLYRRFGGLYAINIPRTQILFAGQQLLRLAERLKMPGAFAMGYRAVGNAHGNLGRPDLALENLDRSISYFEKVDWAPGMADALHSAAIWANNKGETQRALEYFSRSIPNYRRSSQHSQLIYVQNAMASCYVRLGNFTEAYRMLESSIQAAEAQNEAELKYRTLMQLASTYSQQGRLGKALEVYREAYSFAERAKQRGGMADSSYAIAMTYKDQGDLLSAYSYFAKASALHDAIGNYQRSTGAIVNISELFEKRGQLKHSADIYERAIKRVDVQMRRASGYVLRGYTGDKADVLNRLAQLKLSEGDPSGALRILEQAANLLDSLSIGPETNHRIIPGAFEWYRAVRSKIHLTTGDVHVQRKSFPDAKREYTKALEIAGTLKYEPGVLDALIRLSSAAEAEGDHARSIEYSLRAADHLKANKMDERAKIYTNLGRSYRNLKNIPEAEKAFGEAIRIAETIRADPTLKDPGAAGYSSELLEPFDQYIDLLMTMHEREPAAGFGRRAFEVSERRRSRALLDALKDARRSIRRGVDPTLIEQENQVLNQINEAARGQDPFAAAVSPFIPTPEELEIGLLQRPSLDIAALISEHRRIQTAIRAQSPQYAALTQPQPANLAEIETLLDPDTIVLNYTLGQTRSYLWAISKGAVTTHVLPPRAEIEGSVRSVYKYLSDTSLADDSAARADYDTQSARLSKTILGPVAALLGRKRVVVVADGALQYIPFASLPDPRQTGLVPMHASNEIAFAPSISIVGALRSGTANRSAARRSVAIFADPVFSETDERLTMKPDDTQIDNEAVTRSLLLPKQFGSENPADPYIVPRLPYSRDEGQSIFATAAPGTAALAIDFDASRERAVGRELSDFRIVHFATHGVINSELPELSGLVLSLVNKKGEQINGFLRLNEIYNMDLNADLVVLSACETALGKEVRGEGLIGLTRGFMYAGAPRVVASLWKVDDVATAEFMKIFYAKMLKQNMPPAAALRSTKVEMSRSKRWASPHYWAAFELYGDWR